MNNQQYSYTKLWFAFRVVVAASFAVLGGLGLKIAAEAPPIPKVLRITDGKTLFDGTLIQEGQDVWRGRPDFLLVYAGPADRAFLRQGRKAVERFRLEAPGAAVGFFNEAVPLRIGRGCAFWLWAGYLAW